MIKKLIYLLLVPAAVFAQDQRGSSQNVELPEFVITGVERVSMPAVQKPKAELITTLSPQFFKPAFSTEDLPLAELSNPVRKDISFVNPGALYKGELIIGGGIYSWPFGQFTYGTPFENGLFQGKVWGLNQGSYTSGVNSGFNTSGIDVKNSFFTSYNAGFLPGAKYNLSGSFVRDSYRFFASPVPDLQRDVYKGAVGAGMENKLHEYTKFALNLGGNFLRIKDAGVTENIFKGNAFFETGFDGIRFGGEGALKSQSVSGSADASRQFFETRGFIKFLPSDFLHFGGGIYVAGSGSDKTFFLQGNIMMKLDDNLTVLGEMSPHSELITVSDMLSLNRYLNTTLFRNVFVDNKFNIKGALKYRYGRFFEIDGGVRFSTYNNYPYFVTGTGISAGTFDVKTVKATRFSAFGDFLFHPGPSGIFYGSLNLEHFYDDNNNNIPYIASVKSELSYEYNFDFGLNARTGLTYAAGMFADVPNTNKLDPYFNASLKLLYKLSQSFSLYTEFSNLFNRKNYLWYNYQEKPFDASIGIDYRF